MSLRPTTQAQAPVVSYINAWRAFQVNPRANIHGMEWNRINMHDVLGHIKHPPERHTAMLFCEHITTIAEVLEHEPPERLGTMLTATQAHLQRIKDAGERQPTGFLESRISVVTAFEIHHHNVTRLLSDEPQLVLQPRTQTYVLNYDTDMHFLQEGPREETFVHADIQANSNERQRFLLDSVYADSVTLPHGRDHPYVTVDDTFLQSDRNVTVAFLADDDHRKATLVSDETIELTAPNFTGSAHTANMQAVAIALALTSMKPTTKQ